MIGSLASNLQNFARMRTDFASAEPIWNAPQTQPTPPGQLPRGEAVAWNRIDLCDLSYAHPELGTTERANSAA